MKQPPRVVVLGAGYAGVEAAVRAATQLKGLASVTLVTERADFVERIRLHQVAAGQRVAPRALSAMLAGTSVEVRLGRVVGREPTQHSLRLEDGDRVSYDLLIVALGSIVDPSTPGVREHALTLQPTAMGEVRAAVERSGRLVVVGGGLTGVELACELGQSNPTRASISLVTLGRVGEGFSVAAARFIRGRLAALRVEVVEQMKVTQVERGVLCSRQGSIGFDTCLWAAGFIGNPVLRALELDVGEGGRVRVDGCLRALRDERVLVAGDAADVSGHLGSPVRMACSNAIASGAHAADNAVAMLRGREPARFSFFDQAVCVSLGRGRGVFQLRRADGSPGGALTGRLAALIKEVLCRYPLWMISRERSGHRYRWPVAR